MKPPTEQNQRQARAGRRLDKIKSFYMHAAAYILINIVLLIIWSIGLDIAEIFWTRTFYITAGIGAFGVAGHGMAVFGYRYILPKGWEERKINEMVQKDNQTKPQ